MTQGSTLACISQQDVGCAVWFMRTKLFGRNFSNLGELFAVWMRIRMLRCVVHWVCYLVALDDHTVCKRSTAALQHMFPSSSSHTTCGRWWAGGVHGWTKSGAEPLVHFTTGDRRCCVIMTFAPK
jgi:hypothetical protein